MITRMLAAFVLALSAAGVAAAQPLLGHVEQHSFPGPITGKQVLFNVYIPPGYDETAGLYPVVFHLHGLGGSQNSHNALVASHYEAAHLSGLIGPVLVVFPNSYSDAFWADSFDGAKPAETNVVAELIPHVETNFRALADGRCRAVQGFSMGGFGAAKFHAKFPDLFSSGVIYDGAMLTWNNFVLFQPQIAANIFGNNQAYFDQYSPWYWTTQNAAVLQQQGALRSVVGLLVPGNLQFRNHVMNLGIPIEYVETGCGHVLDCLLQAEGAESIAFIADQLGSGQPGDLDCDGDVDQADLGLLLAGWGCQSFCPTDLDGDGAVGQSDLGILLANFGP